MDVAQALGVMLAVFASGLVLGVALLALAWRR